MRDITRAEIDDYLRWVDSEGKARPESFNHQQAELIGDAAKKGRLLITAIGQAKAMREGGFSSKDFILTFWVMAFQMGREFESRLLTEALRNPISARR